MKQPTNVIRLMLTSISAPFLYYVAKNVIIVRIVSTAELLTFLINFKLKYTRINRIIGSNKKHRIRKIEIEII